MRSFAVQVAECSNQLDFIQSTGRRLGASRTYEAWAALGVQIDHDLHVDDRTRGLVIRHFVVPHYVVPVIVPRMAYGPTGLPLVRVASQFVKRLRIGTWPLKLMAGIPSFAELLHYTVHHICVLACQSSEVP